MAKPEAELKKAIKNSDLDRVKQIIAEGLSVDAILPAKVTALEFALAQEQRDIVWELLRLGAKPRPQKGDNLLLDVPKFRDLELLRQLVDLGADVHAADRQTETTPLLCAVEAGYHDAVEFLLEQGADPLARNKSGNSVFQLIERTRRFCQDLLPGSDEELTHMFQTQLDDLDRIEALLESRLSPEHQATLRGEPAPEPEPSTFWDLADGITFELEIAPFPFTSHSASRLAGRLSRLAEQVVEGVVAEGLVDCRVRGADDDDQQPWTTMALTKSDKKWLRYELELHLPANQVTIELRFNNDNAPFDGEIGGWQIEVND